MPIARDIRCRSHFNSCFLSPKSSIGPNKYPEEDDKAAFDAGRRIREGDRGRPNLETIICWKSSRRIKLIAQKSDSEIADALSLALCAKEPRSAFGVLMGLHGVGAPMASAILTAMDQDKYTVIDYRALEALGVQDFDTDLNFYIEHYFPECKRLASETQISLRTLDRALWSWSRKMKSSSTLNAARLCGQRSQHFLRWSSNPRRLLPSRSAPRGGSSRKT